LKQTNKIGAVAVYEVVIFDGLGKRTAADLHKLELADGTKAFSHLHEPDVLFRKLKKMGTPEIDVRMGSIDLMLCLARFLAANPKGPNIHKREPDVGSAA
jgi:hypothetical protein